MKKMTARILLCAAIASLLAGCNTFYGVGEDLSAGGKALSKAATSVQHGGKHTKAAH